MQVGSNKNPMRRIFEDIMERLSLQSVEDVKLNFKKQLPGYEGDFAITLALRESKKSGKNLETVANEIKNKLEKCPFIKKASVLNGYVNCWYNYEYIAKELGSMLDKEYGRTLVGNGERIMIEHTSVNPNKALHIGHVRNSSIGDALARLLRFVGYDVTVTNYIDDTGAQVADNIVGVKYLGFPERKEGVKFDHYLGDEVYVKVNSLYKEDPTLLEKRSEVLKAIEHGENDIAHYARKMVLEVLKAQLQTLDRLNVFYNLVNYESHILAYKFWATAFRQLKEIGAVRLETDGKKKGCWTFGLNSSNNNDDKILVRSDGTVVYAGKDIAYAMWKHGLLDSDFRYKKFEVQKNGQDLWTTTLDKEGESKHPIFNGVKTSINVIDIRQSYEQNVVTEAIAKLGKGKDLRYVHYGYEVVALSKNTAQKLGIEEQEDKEVFQMSGRKGIYINADDFLDQLHRILFEQTKNKNAKLDEKECHDIAEKLAVSTLRYEMVRADPKNVIVFDIDKALKLEEKSAAYLIYTYARISSILKKAAETNLAKEASEVGDLTEPEKKILLGIAGFPDVLERSAKSLDLAGMANYISDFALEFNSFYVNTPVLKAEKEKVAFRLWLIDSCRIVLYNAMILLGLIPIERM
ncbi:MAG: arginine--tRNA ligase [Candidatus Parvarchaeota archaeon]|nr:arginine--tRNA ligase [Candidatus Parvarchaeota archaeon]